MDERKELELGSIYYIAGKAFKLTGVHVKPIQKGTVFSGFYSHSEAQLTFVEPTLQEVEEANG